MRRGSGERARDDRRRYGCLVELDELVQLGALFGGRNGRSAQHETTRVSRREQPCTREGEVAVPVFIRRRLGAVHEDCELAVGFVRHRLHARPSVPDDAVEVGSRRCRPRESGSCSHPFQRTSCEISSRVVMTSRSGGVLFRDLARLSHPRLGDLGVRWRAPLVDAHAVSKGDAAGRADIRKWRDAPPVRCAASIRLEDHREPAAREPAPSSHALSKLDGRKRRLDGVRRAHVLPVLRLENQSA